MIFSLYLDNAQNSDQIRIFLYISYHYFYNQNQNWILISQVKSCPVTGMERLLLLEEVEASTVGI
jgi:hypothetical protein